MCATVQPIPILDTHSTMREFVLRCLKTVVPTAVILAACGYGFAVVAGVYVSGGKDSGESLQDVLVWRLPFTLAAWGGGLVFLYELFRAAWGRKPTPIEPTPATEVDAEQLLQQLLDQADAAEAVRRSGVTPPPVPGISVSDLTPPPRSEPLPVPTFDQPTQFAAPK
jgi:hypothetical protein